MNDGNTTDRIISSYRRDVACNVSTGITLIAFPSDPLPGYDNLIRLYPAA